MRSHSVYEARRVEITVHISTHELPANGIHTHIGLHISEGYGEISRTA